MKRAFDIVISLIGLLIAGPLLLVAAALVTLQDGHSPLYVAPRIGRNGRPFQMVKLRSMVKGADRSGVDSTSTDDKRITSVGRLIRRYKLDEITQLWNVLAGDMSLVGPRPNVKRDVDLYTETERGLLAVRPGITDFSSIVFADEGQILEGMPNPDIAYNQLIRPGKSRLGLFYIAHSSISVDLKLISQTALAIISRDRALKATSKQLHDLGAAADLVRLALRVDPLTPAAPPGANSIVIERCSTCE